MTGQNDTVFTFLAEGNNFVTEYSNKLEEIYSYDETEITDFLVPQTVNGDTDLEVLQREKLVTLRKSLCQTLCVAFLQYGVYELYDRRKLILLAKDILYLGNSIRNVNIDKRLKKTFKNYDDLGNGSQSDETIHPDTPVIGAEDVAVSFIALRDSVLTLNNLVTDLKKEISDLKSHVVKLEVQINKDPQTQTPTEPPTGLVTVLSQKLKGSTLGVQTSTTTLYKNVTRRVQGLTIPERPQVYPIMRAITNYHENSGVKFSMVQLHHQVNPILLCVEHLMRPTTSVQQLT